MKKLLTFVFAIVFAAGLSGQKIGFWFDAGVKGGIGPSLLLNSNVFSDSYYDHKLSTGYGVGAKLGVFYGLYNGLTFEVMYQQQKQKMRFEPEGSDFADHTYTWTSTDLLVLYRLQKEGIYVELGPMFSLGTKVEEDGTGRSDIDDLYVDNMTHGVFGFGGYLLNNGQFTLMFGLRVGYGFTDLIENDNVSSIAANTSFPSQEVYDQNPDEYSSYKSTNPIFLQFMLEANFGIGYFAKTACSNRTAFFRFD